MSRASRGYWEEEPGEQMNIRKVTAALAIVAIVVSGIGLTVFLVFGDRSRPQVTQAAPPPSVPQPYEFRIGVVVTAQNCDPAGVCVYTYTINPKYIGLHPLPETPFTVEYEVAGGHEPQQGQFTVHEGTAEIMKDVSVQGPPGAQLEAAVIRVVG